MGHKDPYFLFSYRGSSCRQPSYCTGPSHLGVWQSLETWMSPELAQPGSAAGRKRSHWGKKKNVVEQRATCKKPISTQRISTARWIAELRVIFPALISFHGSLSSPLNFRWLVRSCVFCFLFFFLRRQRQQLCQMHTNITALPESREKVILLMHNVTDLLLYLSPL